jgi:hypothetical protein
MVVGLFTVYVIFLLFFLVEFFKKVLEQYEREMEKLREISDFP